MLNELRNKTILLKLNGEDFRLRFDLNAISYLEHVYGSFEKALNTELTTTKDIKHFLKAGLLHQYDNDAAFETDDFAALKPTLTEVGSKIGISDIVDLNEQLTKALVASLPEKAEGDHPNAQKEDPVSTGGSSDTYGKSKWAGKIFGKQLSKK